MAGEIDMKFLKYLALALVLSSPVSAYEVNDKIRITLVCLTEASIMEIVEADAKSMEEFNMVAKMLSMTGVCLTIPRTVRAIVNKVLIDYTDWNGRVTQAMQVTLVHPDTCQLHPLKHYTLALLKKQTGT